MSENGELEIKLVADDVWKPIASRAWAAMPPPLCGNSSPTAPILAMQILYALHSRHAGITPQIVAGLVPLLLEPGSIEHARGPWHACLSRLKDELSLNPERELPDKVFARRSFGLVFGTSPIYAVLRLVAPLIWEACRRIGHCYLLCEGADGTQVSAKDYATYAEDLSRALEEMAAPPAKDDPPGRLALFWRERALSLSSLSRAGAGSLPGSSLPEVDPIGLDLLFHLISDGPARSDGPQRLRRLPIVARRQKSTRQKEGGIDGIHMTRSPEDLDSILLSELLYPSPLLEDRLFNTGYLAFERPPKRERVRDVLIAALAPVDRLTPLAVRFAQACWFECMMRLSLLLRQRRLVRSEFRWVEGTPVRGIRSCVFLLQDLPTLTVAPLETADDPYRRSFMAGLRWLPAYLNARGVHQMLPRDAQPVPGIVSQTDFDWERAAWGTQQENDDPGRRLEKDDFAVIHVMDLRPAKERPKTNGEPAAETLGQLRANLALNPLSVHSASITWLPDPYTAAEGWYFTARRRVNESLFAPSPSNEADADQPGPLPSDRGIADCLVQTWLEQLVKEIWNG